MSDGSENDDDGVGNGKIINNKWCNSKNGH